MNHNHFLKLAVFFLCGTQSFFAYDIAGRVKNGTDDHIIERGLEIQLIKLEVEMKVIARRNLENSRFDFLNLEAPKTGPYMIQVSHQGVIYSKTIPPMTPSGTEIVVDVFDLTANFEGTIKARTLYDCKKKSEKTFSCLMINYFMNTSRRTYQDKEKGIKIHIPPNASNVQAAISVGSGTSNIQWLRVAPEKITANFYLIRQALKPGERLIQVEFEVPIERDQASLEFKSPYPQETGMQLIVEPDDVRVFSDGKELQKHFDKNVSKNIIAFEKQINPRLVFSGGSVAKQSKINEGEIRVESPLTLIQKISFPLVLLALFLLSTGWWSRRQARQH